MANPRQAAGVRRDQCFKGRQFTAEVILWAVRWYLMFPISYRDLELMLLDHGVAVDHTIIFRWIQVYAANWGSGSDRLRMSNGRRQPNAACPKAAAEMTKADELWRCSRLRQVKCLNNIFEQDHRNVKRLNGPGPGFGSFWTARRTLAGYEAMAMIRKGQVPNISGNDIKDQAKFIAELFQAAA
jgi:transposase-like protein